MRFLCFIFQLAHGFLSVRFFLFCFCSFVCPLLVCIFVCSFVCLFLLLFVRSFWFVRFFRSFFRLFDFSFLGFSLFVFSFVHL